MPVPYTEIREQAQHRWARQHNFLGVVVWLPFESEAQFNQACRLITEEVAKRAHTLDWHTAYCVTATSTVIPDIPWAAVIAEIVAIVVAVLVPATAPFAPLIEMAVQFLVQLLINLFQSQFTAGGFLATPDAFPSQVQEWAQQAATA